MRILVSGSTGLIGMALTKALGSAGHEVIRLVRSITPNSSPKDVHWNPNANYIQAQGLENLDAVVHLAGEPVASGRWTAVKKNRIRDSRVQGTGLLCEALGHLSQPPGTLLCASATGFYGDRGDEVLTESSAGGTGFLAEVCHDWEGSTELARRRGVRVASLRTGIVLSADGGALTKMLTPFKLGVGGKIGSGRQYMSAIALDDHVAATLHLLATPALSGPVNMVCPQPVTNAEFTKTLGRLLGRPTFLPMPAFAARIALGEMAGELLLASQRVVPAKLEASGFQFKYPTVESALRHALNQ